MKLAISLLVLAACSGSPTTKPTTPTTGTSVPGVIWQTESEPWHLPHAAGAEAVFANVALFGGSNGWLFQIDLRTGKPIRERRIEMGTITEVLHVGGNKWLVVGLSTAALEALTVAYEVDGATLEPTEIKLPTRATKPVSFAIPHAVAVAEGGIVITGRGLPLSIYDPATWGVRTTLDPQLGWSRVSARGDILLAERGGAIKRWNVITNGQRDLPRGTITHVAAGDGIDVIRVARAGQWIAELHPDGGSAVPVKEMIDGLALDSAGKRLITTARTELRVHSLPDGAITKRIPIGDPKVGLHSFRVFGNKVHLTWNGVLRVIDLDTGSITPARPTSQASWLAVGIDGGLLAANDHVWTVSGGKVTATESFTDPSIDTVRSDDPRHYVTSRSEGNDAMITLHTVGEKTPQTWRLEDAAVSNVWLTRDARLLFDVEIDDEHKLVRTKGTAIEPLFPYNPDSEVLAVDPDSAALLSLDGRVAVVGLDGKTRATIRVPHCEGTLDFGVVEPGGTRAVVYDTKDLALWDRTTGKLIAVVKASSPEDILFIPKRQEIVLVFDDRVVLWTPTKGTRTFKYAGVVEPAVSADGKKLALAYFDARLGLYDIDGLISSMPLGADLPVGDKIPETCGEADPLAIPPPDPEDDDDGGDGEDGE